MEPLSAAPGDTQGFEGAPSLCAASLLLAPHLLPRSAAAKPSVLGSNAGPPARTTAELEADLNDEYRLDTDDDDDTGTTLTKKPSTSEEERGGASGGASGARRHPRA